MANLISTIKLPNNDTYDLKDKFKSGVYMVVGTQITATNLFTGNLHGVSALYDGLTIMYYLPWEGVSSTAVTLELTLDDNSTTGPIACYYSGTAALTTHYGKGSNIIMTYYSAGSVSIDGTPTTEDRWICNGNFDTNTKNTAGATNTSSKIFLVGATAQTTNPQTYSDDECYVTNGTLTANIVSTSAGVYVNTANSGTAGGVTLYGTNPNNYGVVMRSTGTASGQMGKHGYVQGDWAIYNTMNPGSGGGRGWVWRTGSTATNIASIDTQGCAVFNGSVTIGGNAANTSGARMEYNTTTQAIDFIFN